MQTENRKAGAQAATIATTFAAASALRSAAAITDPNRRVEAAWDVLARLGPPLRGTTVIADRLEDDGRGEAGVPDRRVLLASARELEEIAATAWGVVGRGGPDPGRVRRPALRADHPTTSERTRRRRRRRLRNPGRRVP
jgi:hypothetical protein